LPALAFAASFFAAAIFRANKVGAPPEMNYPAASGRGIVRKIIF